MWTQWELLASGDMTAWYIHLATIPITLIYANFFEWFWHKYVLHGMGKNPKSFWNFHWGDHHKNARRNNFIDPDYGTSIFKWNAQSKEALALTIGVIIYLVILPFAPFVYLTLFYSGLRYYYVHRRSHTDTEWAKKNLPWHYDHHMNVNQNANWGVTHPWFDHLLKTRVYGNNQNK